MSRALLVSSLALLSIATVACGPETSRRNNNNNNQSGKDASTSAAADLADPETPPSEEPDLADPSQEPPQVIAEDPKTCDEAAMNKSYVGCDYWPTAVANAVRPDFDYTVIVANVGDEDASVHVTGPNSVDQTETVAAHTLKKINLPWVASINPPPADYEYAYPMTATIKATNAAYHLVSDRPVVVYQFSPLQYQTTCSGVSGDCFSYSNDASLLLPSTAMTGNYRIATSFASSGTGNYFAITGTADGTSVTIKAGANVKTLAGGGLAALSAGDTVTFTLDAGEVIEIVSDPGTPGNPAPDTRELSGTLVQADKPVQVVAGDNCMTNPKPNQSSLDDLLNPPTCDHIEETVMPAETLGRKYVVTAPSGPTKQGDVKHTVRIVGNVEGTTLTFTPKLSGVKTTLGAGEVIEIDNSAASFIVEGDHEFAVVTVQKSAKIVDPDSAPEEQKGDPSLSSIVAVEQFRKNYVFLAPDDYDKSFVDIILPKGAVITLDGAPVTGTPTTISTSDFQLLRVTLDSSGGGVHTLEADVPIGIQVIGYGAYTSYQYPGGLNLKLIAPPPEPIG